MINDAQAKPTLSTERELYSMAIHEAAHAVVAYRDGRTIKSMRWIGMGLGGAQVEFLPIEFQSDFDYLACAAAAAAGPLAQLQYCPDSIPEHFHEEPRLLSYWQFSVDQRALDETGYVNEGMQYAKEVLRLPEVECAIKDLAEAFSKKNSRLSGTVAARIIQRSWNALAATLR